MAVRKGDLDDTSKFEAYMESVDEKLRQQGIPIYGRPITAPCIITEELGCAIRLGDAFWARINGWFERRYGDRLKRDFSIGRSVVQIRRDPYLVKFPVIYGAARVNPLTWIQEITAASLSSLPTAELDQLARTLITVYGWFRDIANTPPLWDADVNIAVDQILARQQQYGLSQWASLQAAEKMLKGRIRGKGVAPPNTHNLLKLARLAESQGLPHLDPTLIARVQCEASVRYGEVTVSIDQAIDAHYACIELCSRLAGPYKTASGATAPAA